MDWQISFVFRVPDEWDQGKEVHDRLDSLVAVIPPELWASFEVFVTNISEEDPCRKNTAIPEGASSPEPLSVYLVTNPKELAQRLETIVHSTSKMLNQPES